MDPDAQTIFPGKRIDFVGIVEIEQTCIDLIIDKGRLILIEVDLHLHFVLRRHAVQIPVNELNDLLHPAIVQLMVIESIRRFFRRQIPVPLFCEIMLIAGFPYPDQVNGQVADAASEHFHITAPLFPWLKA